MSLEETPYQELLSHRKENVIANPSHRSNWERQLEVFLYSPAESTLPFYEAAKQVAKYHVYSLYQEISSLKQQHKANTH